MTDEYDIKLSGPDLHRIINMLAERPYREVFRLIHSLQGQGNDQNLARSSPEDSPAP